MLRLLACLLLLTSPLLAQKKSAPPKATLPKFRSTYEEFAFRHKQVKADPIICYGLRADAFTSIGPPAGFNDKRARRAFTSDIRVDYVGYPDDAKAAFQRAVDIWKTIIVSPVPIRIKAFWLPLRVDENSVVLGSAGPTDIIFSPDGTQKARTYYPIALAEKVARRQFNHPDSADIIARFNSENDWYLGLDARPTAGRSDLVSVVLHELGHGLGFTGGVQADPDARQAAYQALVYDRFIENAAGAKLTDPTAITSVEAVYTQVTGRNLYINGPILRQKTGDRARIFAPSTYSGGSSLYHLDEATYPAGTPNALMTPNLSNAEAIHDPGPIVRAFFEDMEWKTTSLLHEPLTDIETVADQVVTARVFSDTTLGSAPPRLYYRQGLPTAGSNTFREVNMVRQGTTNTYSYTIPAAEVTGTLAYFLRTTDGTGRVYSNPGRFIDDTQDVYSFVVGPDRTPPTITHTQEQTLLFAAAADTIPILARVTDDRQLGNARKRGVDTVFVEYQINGQARPAVPLFLLNPNFFPDSTWGGLITIPQGTLRGGDVIRYRIVARDLSAARNQAVSPATGFYEITILSPQATVRSQYFSDFTSTTAAADFGGSGFRIETPTGFNNPSINSDHPYRNGADLNNQSNYTYTLLAPIRVKANPDSAKIRFDEIVLVEPNDAGSVFGGEGFYDYAIVEASKDNGLTWLPLLDGYNSRARPEWLTAYNSLTAVGLPQEVNSRFVGTSSLLRPREVSLLDNGLIRPNDVVLIRFRLFADQLAHGWGWQIDNLYVQQARPVILSTEPALTVEFAASPNPATSSVRVVGELRTTAGSGTLTLISPTGRLVQQVPVPIPANRQIDQRLDVSQLPSGLYFLQLQAGDVRHVRKIMVTH